MISQSPKKTKLNDINSNTRFRRFNFTLYENLDTLNDILTESFNKKDCLFRYVKFQFEKNYDGDKAGKHAQGMALLKEQIRLGSYLPKKRSGIKKLFRSNKIHVDYMNGTIKDTQNYCGKIYNRCKAHNYDSKSNPCRCSLFNLNDFSNCKYCNTECCSQRTLARYDDNSGPFEFGSVKINNHNKGGMNQFSNLSEMFMYTQEMAIDAAKAL